MNNQSTLTIEASAIPLNDKRVINGWSYFDWANSAFALVITAAIFPAYFSSVTDKAINVAGMMIPNTALFAYCISFAYILMAIISPALSGIADYSGRKMQFLKFFTFIGSMACISLFFFEGMEQIRLGLGAFIVAMIGFCGGLVFYNSYLPDISSEDQYDKVSARGFMFGYVGSVLLLIVNLLIITFPDAFGLPTEGTLPVRIAFLMVGLWWIGFAQIPFRRLPKDKPIKSQSNLLVLGFHELADVWRELRTRPMTMRFLTAFFFYNAGVQAVLYLASTFASDELHFETSELILVILILQLLAAVGAYLFAFISKKKGNKMSLLIMLMIWVVICIVGYFITAKTQFYFLAVAVGAVMGGIQSLSRSSYSKLIPEDTTDSASYFSFYDSVDKIATVVGTTSFGLVNQITGGMRASLLTMGVLFILGFVMLLRVHFSKKVVA